MADALPDPIDPQEPPTDGDPHLVTRVLRAVSTGKAQPATDLLPLVYEELRRLAQSRLAKLGAGQTLQATELVHEAWLRVVGTGDPGWECRAHFFGAAAQAMRNILVEQYRSKTRLKRDGQRIELREGDLSEVGLTAPGVDLLILDDALKRLESRDALKGQIVMLRFFTGLTVPAVAELLGLPVTRVEREWRFTRTWLQRELEGLRPR